MAAGKISEAAGIPPSSLSFHLKELAHAGMVTSRQEGRFVIYEANFSTEVGADAIASIAPSFFKPGTVDELVDFFAPICHSAAGLPFYEYINKQSP